MFNRRAIRSLESLAGMICNTRKSLYVISYSTCSRRCFSRSSNYNRPTDTLEHHNEPGLKSPFKLWWAKEITPDIHVAGRLTARQIKYAEEGGFQSIVSLFTHGSQKRLGDDVLPSTEETSKMINSLCNLQFKTVLDTEKRKSWNPKAAVDELEHILTGLKKPILLFSETSRAAAFVTLMYIAKQTKVNSDFETPLNSERFYRIGASMGMDFTSDFYKKIVSEITGEPIVHIPSAPNAEPRSWIKYWQAYPVYRNWFTAGQMIKPTFSVVEEAGFSSIVNLRAGVTFCENPSQEEVTLLNIKEGTGTYGTEVNKPRQNLERLKETRIDPLKSNLYISKTSDKNYESRNEDEFGDDVGYNETIERDYFKQYGKFQYLHLPVAINKPITTEVYARHRDSLLEMGRKGPVLVHCIKARRAGLLSILAAAEQYDKDLTWALRRSRELGYEVSEEKSPTVYEIYLNVLGRHGSTDV
ncbi:uncharacterized protein LOC126826863 [Patella vulgata]|uniref:uncharacterized protein LOC126826863 n=1 Tax=Patella vulgata TaxID=6465 RepID=UPI0024A98DEA|nr:uncharacterized protein LOC126826863 [Patella vulgata]